MSTKATFYYFKIHNGVETSIKTTAFEINTTIMRMYRELTDAQREFYLSNPTASVREVANCELTPPYVPPAPEVQEYATGKVRALKDACYNSVSVTSLEYAMAEDKVNNVLSDSFYSLAEANAILASFRSQSKKAMTVYATYRPQIATASTIEAVDTLYNQAIEAL